MVTSLAFSSLLWIFRLLPHGSICDGNLGEERFSWLTDEGYAYSSVLTVALFVIWLRNREEIESSPTVFGWLRVDRGRAQEARPPDDPGSSGR